MYALFPANTKHLYNIYTMLDVKDVGPTLYKCYTYFCVRWVVPQWVWSEKHKRDVWCDVSPATLQSSCPTRRCVRENYFWAERWKTFQNVAQNLPIRLPDCVYIQSSHHHSTVHYRPVNVLKASYNVLSSPAIRPSFRRKVSERQ